MITTAEIIHTAVKIGLGAIISGLVTIVVFKLNQNKERSQRRRELLEEVAKHVANVDRAGVLCWQIRSGNSSLSNEDETKWQSIADGASADATSIRAILWLLGENRCCDLFKKYWDVIWEVPEVANEESFEGFQKAREPIRKNRLAFFAELSNTYSKL